MPRANRVQPDGGFLAVPQRGQFTGNRGILHDAAGDMGRARWKHRSWITCTIRPRPGRPALPMAAPGHYTPLFFLDEAVACAAGHRPCAECRNPAYKAFKAAWVQAFGGAPSARDIDAALHATRIDPATRNQRRYLHSAPDLPTGAFILLEGQPHLICDGSALPYGPAGYAAPRPLPRTDVTVLTPAPLIAVMQAGWRPVIAAQHDRPGW
ncbi:hypothetical protein [Gemmobacter sp.]|uniref:hypothetical protein n=1 Tax=Gemmobacter sp. TaxID=1898957 RepID=UPI002AFF3E1A|nr:hypothetical protein [Gemmobacter sp.]